MGANVWEEEEGGAIASPAKVHRSVGIILLLAQNCQSVLVTIRNTT